MNGTGFVRPLAARRQPGAAGGLGGGAMTGTVFVRQLAASDSAPLATLYRTNWDYLAPFEPLRDAAFFTADGQAARITDLLTEHAHGRAYPYVIEVGGRLAGRITVTNVARGPFCNGSLGYWVAADQAGRGVATRAVRAVAEDCFTTHQLHRLEAATLVDNLASQAVLRRTGFTLIGRAPRYLRIAGQWRDHPPF